MVGSNAFGFEEVDGVRKHGIEHYLDLVGDRPGRPHRHAHAHVPRSTTGATRSRRSRPRTTPARSRSRSTSGSDAMSDRRRRPRRHRRPGRGHHAEPARAAQRARTGAVRKALPAAIDALRRRRRRRRDDPHRRRSRVLRRRRPEGVRLRAGAAGRGLRRGGRARDDGRLPFRGALPPHTKPLIGAVNGVAVTGGFEVALNCDFLIASDRARFADTHARVGVMPGWGLTVLLAQRIGVGARQADEHHRQLHRRARPRCAWGLVNHVVPHDELLPYCRQARGRHRLERPDGRAAHAAGPTTRSRTRPSTGLDDRGPGQPRVGRPRLRPRRDRGPPQEDRRPRPRPAQG